MSENYKKKSFQKLLDSLQENSWELELLISGFAIFGLFYSIEPIDNILIESSYDQNEVVGTLASIISLFIYILIFNLLLHILLRSLWIGSIGLRYVSGEINYNNLNYSERFTKFLKKKVGSFDDYIGKIENLCSVIFAISFLLIFYVVSIFILIYILNFIGRISESILPNWINYFFLILFTIGISLTFIDFIGQGLLKKYKWTSTIYFPFYRVFSVLTLSFLYRPLIYNFLDNKFGKRVSYILIPFYILIVVASSYSYQRYSVLTSQTTSVSKENVAHEKNYENSFEDKDRLYIDVFAIQSKVVSEPYLKLLVPLINEIEDPLLEYDPSLQSAEDLRGFYSNIHFGFASNSEIVEKITSVEDYIHSFQTFYSFKIDSTLYTTDFVINRIGNRISLESYINIKGLEEGKHVVELQRLYDNTSDSLVSVRKVPFWYFNED